MSTIPNTVTALRSEYDRGEVRFGLSYRQSYFDKLQCELKELKVTEGVVVSIMKVSDVLIAYYLEYITETVVEYGENSSYRATFKAEADYFCDFARLISQRQRFLCGEVVHEEKAAPGIEGSPNLTRGRESADTNILVFRPALADGIQSVDGFEEIDLFSQSEASGSIKCAKYQPYAPGLEFSFNFLLRIFSDEVDTKSAGKVTGVHVIKVQNDTSLTTEYTHELLQQSRWTKNRSEVIVKMVGLGGRTAPTNNTKSVLYQLSPIFTAEIINNVLNNNNLIKAISR